MREFAKYRCDNVFVKTFAITCGKPDKAGIVKVKYWFTLANEPGIDKMATAKIELVRGSEVIASEISRPISVEEKKSNSESLSVQVKSASFGSPVTLRITLTVWDDPRPM